MKDDTQKALEELQEQLLSDDTVTVDFSDDKFLGEALSEEKLFGEKLPDEKLSDDALLEDIINEVHAAQKADLRKTEEQPLKTAPQAHAAPAKIDKAKRDDDRVQTVLMFVVSGLSLGISCLLIFWLVNYLLR